MIAQSAKEPQHDGAPVARRCATVAFLGPPNAGKSTFLNRLVGAQIAPVTRKAQTTRARLRGVASLGETQLVFVDTPGLFAPRTRRDEAMAGIAWESARDADAVLVILDARKAVPASAQWLFAALRDRLPARCPRALALNKVDLVRRPALLTLAESIAARAPFQEIFMISARTGEGLSGPVTWMRACAPESPWLFAPDDITDTPLRTLAADITRAAALTRLHDELPYRLDVAAESWVIPGDGSARITQAILVANDRHRRMVIGKGGATIKAISMAARKRIEALLGHRAHLMVRVCVRVRPDPTGGKRQKR